jgi:hypothetical protein
LWDTYRSNRVLFIVIRWCGPSRWRGRERMRGAKAKRDGGVRRPLPAPPPGPSQSYF